jgi:EAL domain-containing protein (putative c-di-GMP-specific phosphodiesterase class I)
VAPTLFMAMAEQSGLAVTLGNWMLGRMLGDAASWPSGVEVTVPVSPVQLNTPGFAADVAEALAAAGIAPSRLVCDVFCNAISADDRIAMTEIDTLRRSGVRIAVSDFSAGIAGLAMNRVHPIDRVRLDTDHIKAIAGEARFVQMLSLFLQLASTVDIPVTLTGVDSRKDLECAISAGAVEVEGCFAGPALSATEVRELTSVGAAASGDGRMQLAS